MTGVLKLICQQKLMPILDAFQSCFKNETRFFAGMYFLYRTAILAAVTFSRNEIQLYGTVELIFLMILGIHAIVQPYKQERHNMIDATLFLNLAIINGLNIFINVASETNLEYNRSTGVFSIIISVIQLVLVYFPVVAIIFKILFNFITRRLSSNSESIDSSLQDRSDSNSNIPLLLSARS